MSLRWYPFRIPLTTPFRGVTYRTGAVVAGPSGWGEYSPFPGYSDGEVDRCRAAAVACATVSWPEPLRASVPVHVTVPALGPDEAAALVRNSGCPAAKVKVAEGDDYSRVEAVRDALGPGGLITVDANGAWSVDQAVRQIDLLAPLGLALVEQPVRTLEEMSELRRRVEVPLAADELVTSAAQARRIAEGDAADALVLKVQSLGGIHESIRTVQSSGLPGIVSSLVETSVGLSAALALAAALDELPYTCGLDTAGLLAGDLVAEPLLAHDGAMRVRRPEADPQLLARWGAGADHPEWVDG